MRYINNTDRMTGQSNFSVKSCPQSAAESATAAVPALKSAGAGYRSGGALTENNAAGAWKDRGNPDLFCGLVRVVYF